jgi:hypothetical protein
MGYRDTDSHPLDVNSNIELHPKDLNIDIESKNSSFKLQASRFKLQDSRFKIQASSFKLQVVYFIKNYSNIMYRIHNRLRNYSNDKKGCIFSS